MKTNFTCNNCAYVAPKWQGKCPECNSWNTLLETNITEKKEVRYNKPIKSVTLGTKINYANIIRTNTNIKEVDQVLGGGMVTGSVVLVGGSPGIGKSTLMLQILNNSKIKSAYISAEESLEHIVIRAKRIGIENQDINIITSNILGEITASIKNLQNIKIVIIDSIQTIYCESISSSPGTISQVKHCTQALVEYARKEQIILFIIGQITKDGQIAGPKVMEHMVDTVLYFEDEVSVDLRILRAIKNRFGAANELGIFEMSSKGLQTVKNPSEIFLSTKEKPSSGSVIFAGIEGSRPILVEIQSLVINTNMSIPRRAVVGWDINRLNMIIAVIQSKCNIFMGNKEVYLNISGGIKITEPAMDLAVAISLLSSYKNKPLSYNTIAFGEISLSGEIKVVSSELLRLKEAEKLGIKNAITPNKNHQINMYCNKLTNIKQLIEII